MSFEPPSEPPGHVVLRPSPLSRLNLLAIVPFAAVLLLFTVISGSRFVVVVIIGAASLYLVKFAPRIFASFRWHTGELIVPNQALTLGGSVPVTFRRFPRRPHAMAPTPTLFRLRCIERASYRQGTDRRTDEEVLVNHAFTVDAHPSDGGLVATAVVEIPANRGGPSIDFNNNEIRWELVVRFEQRNLPRDEHTFELLVSQVLDPSLRDAMGDR